MLHGARYTVSSVDLVLSTQDVSYTFMLTAQLILLEVRTLILLQCTWQDFLCSCNIPGMMLHYGDLTDASSLVRLVTEVRSC